MKFQTPVAKKPLFLTLLLAVFLHTGSCKTDEPYPELDQEVAGPIDLVEKDGLFYILNSDFDRRFLNGSILAIDPDASEGDRKLFSVKVPRLGRSLFRQDDLLLVTFTSEQVDSPSEVQLRAFGDVNGEKPLPLKKSWQIDCSPINGILSPSKRYVVVSCVGGDIWAGRIDSGNFQNSSLIKVRSYKYTRRALYIHETESGEAILMAFPTDIGEQESIDFRLSDEKSFTAESKINDDGSVELEDKSNEVPDSFEEDLFQLGRQQRRGIYQMVVYNLTKAEEEKFPYVDLGTSLNPTQANRETRFIYYNLKGRRKDSNDLSLYDIEPEEGKKDYHTNYWAAKPLNDGSKGFYLSQRGRSIDADLDDGNIAAYSNNIIKVSIKDEASLTTAEELPPTSELFSFERVYGTNLDIKNNLLEEGKFPYPSDFEFFQNSDSSYLVINDFKDVLWPVSDQLFSIYAIELGSPEEIRKVGRLSGGVDESFFQIAVSAEGYIASCSYYGNAVLITRLVMEKGELDSNIIRIGEADEKTIQISK